MLIELNVIWTIIINFFLWLVIHLSFAYIFTIIPVKRINTKSWIFKQMKWEQNGKIYEDVFHIKKWKGKLPDGAALFKNGFQKKSIASKEGAYFIQFYIETCRAELVHWIVILFSPVFFIWNPLWAGAIMIIYAILANLPCIIAQRYNRIRFKRILNSKLPVSG